MILIVSDEQDLHARHVANLIRKRGEEATIVDFAHVAEDMRYSHRLGLGTNTLLECGHHTRVNFSEIVTIWFRRPSMVAVPDAVIDPIARQFIRNEWSEAMNGMVLGHEKTRWVNHPIAQIAATKTLQLKVAEDVGLKIPATLVSNDPVAVRRFIAELDGDVIHKSLTTPKNYLIDTRRWNSEAEDLVNKTLSLAPAIFQKFIEGPADLRINIFGNNCFAARIETQSSSSDVDSRLNLDIPYFVYAIPEVLLIKLRELMRKLNLCFGVVDMKIDNAGEFVFLEINPQGQFLFVEILTGMEISAALAEFLCDTQVLEQG